MADIEFYQGALTGEQIDALPNRLGNRNLLDNWFFGNPVNQRNQTIYTGTAQYWDRWKSTNSGGSATIQSGYISLGCTGSNPAYYRQVPDGLPAGTYTVSALVRGTGAGAVGLTVGGVLTNHVTFTLSDTENWTCVSRSGTFDTAPDFFTIRVGVGATIDVLAVKLEFGESQTLAYQINGAWQLNDIPNYQQELAKCQRYLYVVNSRKISYVDIAAYTPASTSSSVFPLVVLPVPLRASSTQEITISDYSGVLLRTASGDAITPSSITVYRICGTMLKLSVAASDLTAGTPYLLGYTTGVSSQFIISCEL